MLLHFWIVKFLVPDYRVTRQVESAQNHMSGNPAYQASGVTSELSVSHVKHAPRSLGIATPCTWLLPNARVLTEACSRLPAAMLG